MNNRPTQYLFFFFFNDTATTEIYTLSLHDALPICLVGQLARRQAVTNPERTIYSIKRFMGRRYSDVKTEAERVGYRSEEHTSELQSRQYLVCRLLLEKKKQIKKQHLLLTHTICCIT